MTDDERDEAMALVCATWLQDVLFPLALDAASLPAVTTPADALALQRQRVSCYVTAAEVHCSELAITSIAATVAHWADRDHGRRVRDAIWALAIDAGHERAWANDRAYGDTPTGITPPADFVADATRADTAFDRWEAVGPAAIAAMMQLVHQLAELSRGDS